MEEPDELGDPAALPDEAVIGWCGSHSGHDRLILRLLEAGFRPVRECGGSDSPRFRVVRSRRDGYRIRGYKPGNEVEILGLFEASFGDRLSLPLWRWRYLDNPLGGPRISLAFAPDGQVVCQYCAYPVRFRGLPPSVPAVNHQVGDTMTRPGVRAVGRGPTSLLARTARHFHLTHCHDRVGFNYGFNAGNITQFSTRFVGAEVVEDAPFRVLPAEARLGGRPGRVGRYELRRITEKSAIGTEFDELCDRSAAQYGVMVDRSATYLRWRYLDCPGGGYRMIAASRRGRLAGWAVAKHLGDRVELGDALVDPAERPALRALLAGIREAGLPTTGWFSERPAWWSREIDRLGFERRLDPEGLVTIMVPFMCADAAEQIRRHGYYMKGDGDLF